MVSKARAVLLSFLPGNKGGEAVADIIFGDFNPNGRLPITYPKHANGLATYDHKPLESLGGNKIDVLYPFGHGLSYTQYRYSELNVRLTVPSGSIDRHTILLSVSVKVDNMGSRDGKETVILYVSDEIGSVSRPNRQVKGFEKILVKTGGPPVKVKFELTAHDLSFINANSERVVEAG